MWPANVEIVRRATEAALSRPPDWDTLNALFDADHEFVALLGGVEGGEPYIGAAGWSGWMERMSEAGEWFTEIDGYRAAPDGRVVILFRFSLIGARSGVPTETRTATVVTLADGRIVRSEVFTTVEDGLKAAGLAQ